MLIQGKRIHKLACHLPDSAIGSGLIIGVRDIQRFQKKLEQAGFVDFAEGESVFNADGKDEPQKDLPKEEVCWMREWHWKEWRGQNEPEEVSDFRDQCRERYPRKHIPAPCVYLTIATNSQGKNLAISPACIYSPDSPSLLLHTINLFLELFGACEIFRENLDGECANSSQKLENFTSWCLPLESYPPGVGRDSGASPSWQSKANLGSATAH
jgi:hypothetical protein